MKISMILLGIFTRQRCLRIRRIGLKVFVLFLSFPKPWTSPAGEAIKAQLNSDVPGLPQSEASFKITYCTPDQFNNLLTYVRNILIVKIDSSMYTKVSIRAERDLYAKNQVVMRLNAPSTESIVEHIKSHPTSIIDYFNQIETDRMINILNSEYSSLVMKHARHCELRGSAFTSALLQDPLINLRYKVHNEEILNHLPSGAFATVSNHPIGSLDGIILIDIFASRRPDFKVME